MTDLENTGAVFGATSWTLIDALRDGDEGERRRVMEMLVRLYWPPVYAFLRQSGYGREAAAEVTQGFFADKVIEKELFSKARRERGRLRSLVLCALKRYVIDEHRKRRARPDGRAIATSDLEREECSWAEMAADESAATPERVFELRWAQALFSESMERCEKHCREGALARHWEVAEQWFVRPAVSEAERPGTDELAERYGFGGPRLVSAAVQLVKKHWQARLEEVIAETIARWGFGCGVCAGGAGGICAGGGVAGGDARW